MALLGSPLGALLGGGGVSTTQAGSSTSVNYPPRDIKLTASGDWDMTGGDLNLVSGPDSIVQDISQALQLIQTEYLYDESAGIPLFDRVLVKNPNLAAIRALYKSEILARAGVTSVASVDLTFDRTARKLKTDFKATADASQIAGSVSTGV